MKVKDLLKEIYRSLPLKPQIIKMLNALGGGRWLPDQLKRYLVFEGEFELYLKKESTSFSILNGYGRDIERLVFWNGIEAFETGTVDIWRLLARDASVIVDVGANTGIYSLLAKSVNPQAKVYAFEPMRRIFSILESNLELNARRWKGSPKIIACQVALSDYNGIGDMFDLPVEHMYTASLNKDIHLERGNTLHSVTESVQVQRLDSFCTDHDIIPDLVKIDVESHEPAVLRGMGEFLKRHQPSIICEIWDNTVGAAVEAVIRECGYRYIEIGPTIVEKSHVRNDDPDKGYINYLFVSDRVYHSLLIQDK